MLGCFTAAFEGRIYLSTLQQYVCCLYQNVSTSHFFTAVGLLFYQ